MPGDFEDIGFRAATDRDLALIRRWADAPHWRQWRGEPDRSVQEIRQAMDDLATEPLIAELAGRPVAYVQVYDPHMADDHPCADQPTGSLGIDLALGPAERLGQGLGPAILDALADELFGEGAPRLLSGPAPDDGRAIRAFEKAGFVRIGERRSPSGRVLLMARDAEDEFGG